MTTHKMCKGTEYQAWKGMIQNCTNTNASGWKQYGEKGINVSSEFRDFIQFLCAMGKIPENFNALLRKDKNLDFCRENCYWGRVTRGRPRGATKIESLTRKKKNRFKNPRVLSITLENDLVEFIRKQALNVSVARGFIVETSDLVREALTKHFPLPSQYDMFGSEK